MDRLKVTSGGWLITTLAAYGINRHSHHRVWYSRKHAIRADSLAGEHDNDSLGEWSNPNMEVSHGS